MKIKKLMPMDAESRRLIDWMEKGTSSQSLLIWKRFSVLYFFFFFFNWFDFTYMAFAGVYDALQKKYLKTLLFCICEAVDGPMIEEYACKFPTNFIMSWKIWLSN